ncbi:MAG: GNAT family N-acetyltransferase [Candidatus Acidiferrales bacterium]
MLRIVPAVSKETITEASILFREYAAALTVDLTFQDFQKELASLPGEYAPPEGRLLIASIEPAVGSNSASGVAGCIGLRKIDAETCEMKRLFVRTDFRGMGVGRALALGVISAAREVGYLRMRLDTLPEMSQAQALYFSLGFKEIEPYRFNPIPGARFLELALR